MKVLMLNAYFEPEQIAFTHLEKDLLDAFVHAGFHIDIITPVPTRGIDDETRKKYRNRKHEELYDGAISVHRFWAPQEDRNPIKRALRYFWCNLREYQIGKKYLDADVIFCPSTPPTQGLMAGKVKKSIQKHGNEKVRFVYNLQDIFPDSLVTARMTQKGSVLWKIGRAIENQTYRFANKIIVISEDFRSNLLRKDVNESKITLIPNWIDTEAVVPIERKENDLFDKYALDRRAFYICYSGNIGHSQNIPMLIEAAKVMQKKLPEAIFVVIGEGAAKTELENAVNHNNLQNIKLLPFQLYKDISKVFSLGDVGLIISKKGIGNSSVPSKTWSIMSAGRPIIASFDIDSELGKLLEKTESGIVVQPDDIEGFVDAIISLNNNSSIRNTMGNNGLEFVRKYRNKADCTKKYIEQFDDDKEKDEDD